MTQHLNVIPDWDMFQTVHEYSGFHAAARCVSGGPIYIVCSPTPICLTYIADKCDRRMSPAPMI